MGLWNIELGRMASDGLYEKDGVEGRAARTTYTGELIPPEEAEDLIPTPETPEMLAVEGHGDAVMILPLDGSRIAE